MNDRAKWFGLLFILFVLAGIVLTRPLWEFMLPGAATPPPPTVIADVPTTPARSDGPADDATAAPELEATPESLVEPVAITGAEIAAGATGEMLLLYGSAAPNCPIDVLLDGAALGQTQSDEAGGWTLNVLSPAPGEYVLQAICNQGGELISSAETPFIIPAPVATPDGAATAEPDVSATETLTPTLDTSEEPTDLPPDDTAGVPPGEETGGGETGSEPTATPTALPEPTAEATPTPEVTDEATPAPEATATPETVIETLTPPTFSISNDLAEYVGGPLRLIGRGTPGDGVTVRVTAADGSVVDETGATVNADGNWGAYALIAGAGDYAVEAEAAGVPAEPIAISVPEADFGAAGSCRGRVPPLGTLDRAALTYTVADCEYFSLIANRLGVSFSELQAANPQLTDLNLLGAGGILVVPPLP